jgi:hypothetical protein
MVVELVVEVVHKEQMEALQQSHLVEQLTQPQVVVVAEVVVLQVVEMVDLVVVDLLLLGEQETLLQ